MQIRPSPYFGSGIVRKPNAPASASTSNLQGLDLVHALTIPYKVRVYSQVQNSLFHTTGVSAADAFRQLAHKSIIVQGDLHGSYLKLLETLAVCGLIAIPTADVPKWLKNSEDMDKQIGKDANFIANRDEAKQIEGELLKLAQRVEWVGGDRQLILLGDIIGDRGPLDTVTMALLHHLKTKAPNGLVWINGNHDFSVATDYADSQPRVVLTAFFGKQSWLAQHQSYFRSWRLRSKTEEAQLKEQYCQFYKNSQLFHYDAQRNILRVSFN